MIRFIFDCECPKIKYQREAFKLKSDILRPMKILILRILNVKYLL